MIFVVAIIFIVFLVLEIIFLKKFKARYFREEEQALLKISSLKEQNDSLEKQIKSLESEETAQFLFYDLARKIAPSLNKEEIFGLFAEEIKHLGGIEKISFGQFLGAGNYFKFDLGKYNNKDQALAVKTASKRVIEFLPLFAKLLKLCLDKIKLYEKIQRLSIYDSLTDIYNRRYFMYRFLEEFERAKKFNLNLSFLMVDVDHFKNINDSCGHLVGDAVLREVALRIKESVREIDCVGRFGGEEFSVILLDTEKSGAIMVAERICSKIRERKIKAFDEQLTATVSVGVSSFPQNTIHSDVLIELADKVLYKAKVSGRNRACWF
ncbi:MAG: GGDEF domain-containing protein [Candidatus Omnitrophota bacterium]|nr:MAG: GGDEF domain-containing protein [Candidatus Omnitrophota bacterium]